MLLSDNDVSNYVTIDKETVKTCLFNSLASDKLYAAGVGYLIISIQGTQYWFNKNLNLVEVTPSSKNVYAITTKGFVPWKNPARKFDNFGKEEMLGIGSKPTDMSIAKTICSNYVCIEDIPENKVKISKDNVIAVEFFTSNKGNIGVEIEENNNELSITNKGNVAVSIEVKEDDAIFPLFGMTQNSKIILTRGTCFKIQKRHAYFANPKRRFKYQEKEIYLCY